MMSPVTRTVPVAVALALAAAPLAVLGAGPAVAVPTWTEIATGTTEDITAVEYQSADRLWFATNNGHLYKVVNGVAQLKYTASSATSFTDLEFQAGGGTGLAVGTNGVVVRSTNAGDTWSPITLPASGHTGDQGCANPQQLASDLDSVTLDDTGRAWISGRGSQLWSSSSAGSGWVSANGNGTTCRVPRDVDDVLLAPGSVYFVTKYFGEVYLSNDGLLTPASQRPAPAGNGFTATRRVAGDPANPQRQWAVSPEQLGGSSFVARTTDGWSTSAAWGLASPTTLPPLYDVDAAGGTVLAVGDSGAVVTSTDGATFTVATAGTALASVPWRAVSLADGNNAAIGGVGGRLAVTADAISTAPPPAPTPPAPTAPAPAAKATPTLAAKAPVQGGAAKVAGRAVKVRVAGTLGVPAGAACTGTVGLTLTRGKKVVAWAAAPLASGCRYAARLSVKRAALKGARRLVLGVSFAGNEALGPVAATYRIKVKAKRHRTR
jgi:photosystem II stability/assembly factor-like uncharacterized protein